ncbi:hypothetical protein pb186bvf_011586 [Paramecium bursaria]
MDIDNCETATNSPQTPKSTLLWSSNECEYDQDNNLEEKIISYLSSLNIKFQTDPTNKEQNYLNKQKLEIVTINLILQLPKFRPRKTTY